jgi:hypothetical protein
LLEKYDGSVNPTEFM